MKQLFAIIGAIALSFVVIDVVDLSFFDKFLVGVASAAFFLLLSDRE